MKAWSRSRRAEQRFGYGRASDEPSARPRPRPRSLFRSRLRPRSLFRSRTRRRFSARKLPAPDPAGALLTAADLARREGRAAAAVDALATLLRRHPRDPRAPSAAFTLGRLLLEEQNDPARAAAAFARVGELDPRSPLAEDALARQVQAWSRAGSKVRARALAERYLARYPGSARTAFVREHGGL